MSWNWVKFTKFYRAYDFHNARANMLCNGPIKKRVKKKCTREENHSMWMIPTKRMNERPKKTQIKLIIWKTAQQLHYSNDSSHNQLPRTELHTRTHSLFTMKICYFFPCRTLHIVISMFNESLSRFVFENQMKKWMPIAIRCLPICVQITLFPEFI